MKTALESLVVVVSSLVFSSCAPILTLISVPPPTLEAGQKTSFKNLALAPESANFRAGFSKRKITPPDTQWLAGYYPSRLGLVVHDDLWAKCLVVEDQNGSKIGIASLDLIGLLPGDVKDIQREIALFFEGKVLIHTTHTHSAPDTMGLWGANIFIPISTGRDEHYVNFVKKETIDCLREASQNKEEAMLLFAQGQALNLTKGPAGISHDESILLMHLITKNGSLLLVNYAVHPKFIYSSYVTADFLYYMYSFLEGKTGGEVLFVNGAIGAVDPRGIGGLLLRWPRAKEFGLTIGKAILDVLSLEKPSEKPTISWSTAKVKLGPENKLFHFAAKLGLMPEERDNDGLVETEVNYITIGDAGIITIPGEPFPNVTFVLKEMMPDKYRFTFGLTNGGLGYFIFSSDFQSKKYPYNTLVSLGPSAGDKVFEALRTLILRSRR